MKLKITAVGNAFSVVLPKPWMDRLQLKEGDYLYASETVDGIQLSHIDPEFEEQMAIVDQIMHEDREVLCKLAQL